MKIEVLQFEAEHDPSQIQHQINEACELVKVVKIDYVTMNNRDLNNSQKLFVFIQFEEATYKCN